MKVGDKYRINVCSRMRTYEIISEEEMRKHWDTQFVNAFVNETEYVFVKDVNSGNTKSFNKRILTYEGKKLD